MVDYGNAPIVIGGFDPIQPEMMFYLCLPIFFPSKNYSNLIPDRLRPYEPMIDAAWNDYEGDHETKNHFMYITAKTLFVTKENAGNRPGWHVDGFGSNGDINYIWSDKNPTEFVIQSFFDISKDDGKSMEQMTAQAKAENIVTYPNNTLLRLDESIVHRVGPVVEEGVRRFVKITFSKHIFNNEGNSRNYLIDYDWPMMKRGEGRNLDSSSHKVD